MKNIILWGILGTCSLSAWASDEAIFQAAFHGMFEPPQQPIALRVAEPMPPVPLDGGVALLLAAGMAAARKSLKK